MIFDKFLIKHIVSKWNVLLVIDTQWWANSDIKDFQIPVIIAKIKQDSLSDNPPIYDCILIKISIFRIFLKTTRYVPWNS